MRPTLFQPRAVRWCVPIAALAILTIGFGGMAIGRLVDQDEGFYLLAARLVLDGKQPYTDFFYPQMPLLPYAYGAWMAAVGVSWAAARLFSAACSVMLGALLYWRLARSPGTPAAGLLGVILLVSSSLTLSWFPLVKTYALSTLLVFAASLAMEAGGRTSDRMALGLAGALLGLAIDTRLLMVGTLPAFLVGCCPRGHAWPRRRRALAWFMGGLILTLSPNLVFMARDLNTFVFDNLGYHALRHAEGAATSGLWQRAQTVLQLLGLPLVEIRGSLQFSMLIGLVLWGCLRSGASAGGTRLAVYIAACLFLVSCLPTPIHLQYFSVIVPFLILAGVQVLPVVLGRLGRAGGNRAFRVQTLQVIALIAYVASVPLDVYRFTLQGRGVPGIGGPVKASGWTIAAVREVSAEINRLTQPNEMVISWWPGYLAETHATALPGTENHFGVDVASKLETADRTRRRVLSAEDVSREIRQGRSRIVVSGSSNFMDWTGVLGERSGYVLTARLGDADLYVSR